MTFSIHELNATVYGRSSILSCNCYNATYDLIFCILSVTLAKLWVIVAMKWRVVGEAYGNGQEMRRGCYLIKHILIFRSSTK